MSGKKRGGVSDTKAGSPAIILDVFIIRIFAPSIRMQIVGQIPNTRGLLKIMYASAVIVTNDVFRRDS
uniref:ParB domain protein nuclease n=1 Tax=uncultured marine virus TaxID=186617 RepID=A0A0F7L2P5_9VIRU|nr:ParB domain protein nuclease [uncultured marine virus]